MWYEVNDWDYPIIIEISKYRNMKSHIKKEKDIIVVVHNLQGIKALLVDFLPLVDENSIILIRIKHVLYTISILFKLK